MNHHEPNRANYEKIEGRLRTKVLRNFEHWDWNVEYWIGESEFGGGVACQILEDGAALLNA